MPIRWLRRSLDLVFGTLVIVVLATLIYGLLGPRLGHQPLVIRGGSMSPTFSFGSVVDATAVPSDQLAPGDVVSVRAPNGVIDTHRVSRVITRPDGIYLETKGDANSTADPVLVPASAVIGRIDFRLPLVGYLIYMLSTASGVLSLFCLALTLLLSIWLLEDLEGGDDPGGESDRGGQIEPWEDSWLIGLIERGELPAALRPQSEPVT